MSAKKPDSDSSTRNANKSKEVPKTDPRGLGTDAILPGPHVCSAKARALQCRCRAGPGKHPASRVPQLPNLTSLRSGISTALTSTAYPAPLSHWLRLLTEKKTQTALLEHWEI